MISKTCKYAIRATVYIASRAKDDVKVGVKEIAKEIEAPEPFTGKILQKLKSAEIVTSVKGPYGGFYCDEKQLELPIIKVVETMDGLDIFRDCVFGLHKCSDEHPCPMHFQYVEVREQMYLSFKNTTVGALAENLNDGLGFLKNP